MEYILHLKACCLNQKHGEFAETELYHVKRNLNSLHASEDRTVSKIFHAGVPVINFIIPLSGKLAPFLHFIKVFEKSFLDQQKEVTLLVILFWNKHNQRESWEVISSIKQLKGKFPNFDINLIPKNGEFNRGIALNIGASMFKENDLLFFVDVDCFINPDILNRILLNTIQHQQAYFPIMFSLYNSEFVWKNDVNFTNFTEEIGYWRFHSFGQLSVYKSDFTHIGGYDATIRGWGKEDIDLFQKFLDKGITPFRAPDPGLIHIFHDVHCGLELPHEQYRMCLGTKWSTFGCQKILSDIVYSKKENFERNKFFNNCSQCIKWFKN